MQITLGINIKKILKDKTKYIFLIVSDKISVLINWMNI